MDPTLTQARQPDSHCPPHWWLLPLLVLLLFAAATQRAAAQADGQFPRGTSQVYSFVEQAPALPGGGGYLALIKAVQQQLLLPTKVREGRTEGRVYVRAIIGVSGVARQATVAQHFSPACNAAALAAMKRLPRLVPGRYQNQPVAVLPTVTGAFLSPRHVFAASEMARPAQFPGGEDALKQYLQTNKKPPNEAQQRDLQGRVTLRFVLKPDGRVVTTEVLTSLCPSCDEEALRLPRFMPGRHQGQPVAVRLVVPVVVDIR